MQIMELKYNKSNRLVFLENFNRSLRIVLGMAAVGQIGIDPSGANIFATICCCGVWFSTEVLILRRINLLYFTLSTLLILGFSLSQFCLPLIFTLVEGKSVVYNLDLPIEVFTHSTLAFIVFLLSHETYKAWRRRSEVPFIHVHNILKSAGIYDTPSNAAVWIMGFVGIGGLIGNFFSGDHYSIINDSERGGASKIFQALTPFAYTPFFFPLKSLFEKKNKPTSINPFSLGCYAILLLVIGIGGNSRGIFMTGVTSAAVAYFLGLLVNRFDSNVMNARNVLLGFLGLWLITGPLSDLGMAMVIVRADRANLSNAELIDRTLDAYQNKNALAKFKRMTTKSERSQYDEHYFDNIFLSRFCNLKFNDSSLLAAERTGHVDEKMLEFSIDRFWAVFPLPMLKAFQINIDKDAVISSSFGDYLSFRAYHSGSFLGGHRTGHFAGTGLSAFGWWYLLLLFIGALPLYYLFDLFVFSSRQGKGTANENVYISLAGLLLLSYIFMILATAESVVSHFTYLFRGWIQFVFLYWIISQFARKASIYLKR